MSKSIKKNILLNSIKQMLSIIYPLITIPYATRVLQVYNYGSVEFSRSIIDYFALLAGLGITNYAIREGALLRNERKKFIEFANQVFTINCISTVFSYCLLIIILVFSKNDKINSNIYLLLIFSISIVLNTLGADWINSIFEDYFYLTIRYLIIQVIALMAIILLVKSPQDYLKYSIILLFSSSGGNLLNIIYIRKYVKLRLTFRFDFKQHIKPIMYLFASSIATTIYISSDVTLIGMFYSEKEVGFYSLASKCYSVIKQIINAAITVTIPRLSAYLGQHQKNMYNSLLDKLLNHIWVLLIPMVTGVYSLSREIILFIGGNTYLESTGALKVLSIALLFAILSCFYSKCIMLPNKLDREFFRATLMSAMTNIGLNLFFIPSRGYIGAAYTTLIAEILMFVMVIMYSNKVEKISIEKNNIIASVIGSTLIFVICKIVKGYIVSNMFAMLVAISISVITYMIILIIMKCDIVITIRNIFAKKNIAVSRKLDVLKHVKGEDK